MTWGLIVMVAVITFGSRLLGLVASPRFDGRAREFVEALPAPLFAALAVASMIGTADPLSPTLVGAFLGAAMGVLLRRSLLAALAGGVAGFAGGALLATTAGLAL